jgi:hypothetical protein
MKMKGSKSLRGPGCLVRWPSRPPASWAHTVNSRLHLQCTGKADNCWAAGWNAIFLAGFSGLGPSAQTNRLCRPVRRRASISTDMNFPRLPASETATQGQTIIGRQKTSTASYRRRVDAVLLANCSQATRMLIPHQTTATAMMMQVTVRAFSMADEGIVMLSFAYPSKR